MCSGTHGGPARRHASRDARERDDAPPGTPTTVAGRKPPGAAAHRPPAGTQTPAPPGRPDASPTRGANRATPSHAASRPGPSRRATPSADGPNRRAIRPPATQSGNEPSRHAIRPATRSRDGPSRHASRHASPRRRASRRRASRRGRPIAHALSRAGLREWPSRRPGRGATATDARTGMIAISSWNLLLLLRAADIQSRGIVVETRRAVSPFGEAGEAANSAATIRMPIAPARTRRRVDAAGQRRNSGEEKECENQTLHGSDSFPMLGGYRAACATARLATTEQIHRGWKVAERDRSGQAGEWSLRSRQPLARQAALGGAASYFLSSRSVAASTSISRTS